MSTSRREPDPQRVPDGAGAPAATDDGGPASPGGVRRRAAYLYGLIICGAVLAAEPENISAWLVGFAVVATMLVYWTAETFAHWVGARGSHGRRLTRPERWETVADGFPLVLAGLAPALVVFIEAVAGVTTSTAIQVALLVNLALLGVVGWVLSPGGRWFSSQRLGYAAVTVVLGVAMIELKNLVHH